MHMKVSWSHVKDDSASQCARRPASNPKSTRCYGGYVAFRLSAGGDQGNSRETNTGGNSRTFAQARTGFGGDRYCCCGTRRARGAMIVLDASAVIDWLLQNPSRGRSASKPVHHRVRKMVPGRTFANWGER